MYGTRARIGYCSPPVVTETFCTEWYMMAPKGVTLMLTTLAITSLTADNTKDQMARSHERALDAARAMARAGADLVVLGGNPINQSRGVENLDSICDGLSREIGTKVITSTQSQMKALKVLGARKVATVHPFVDELNEHHDQSTARLGVEATGSIACGYTVETLGKVPGELALKLSREIKRKHPETDTIHPSCAHWATAHAIDSIESELAVNVMTSQQAILWNALRTAGIDDRIEGYGRLLREF